MSCGSKHKQTIIGDLTLNFLVETVIRKSICPTYTEMFIDFKESGVETLINTRNSKLKEERLWWRTAIT